LGDFFVVIWLSRHDKGTVEQINWETVRGQIVGSSDLCDTSVGGHHDDGGLVRFESSVQEGEAFDIKHMDLIDEEDTRHDLGSSLLTPFCYLLINLFSNLGLNFTNISCE